MNVANQDSGCQPRSAAILPPAGEWFWIDCQVIQKYLASLTPGAVKIYLALAAHTDSQRTAWPSIARLTKLCGISKRSVHRGIADLEAAGLIGVERSKLAGIPQPNRYTLLPRADSDTTAPMVLSCHGDTTAPMVLSCHHGSDTTAPITRCKRRRDSGDDDGDFLISWEEAQALAQLLWRGGLRCMTGRTIHNGSVVSPGKPKFMPIHHKRRILEICGLAVADQLDRAWLVDAAEKVAARRPDNVADYFRECVRTTAAAHGADLDHLIELVRVPNDFPTPQTKG